MCRIRARAHARSPQHLPRRRWHAARLPVGVLSYDIAPKVRGRTPTARTRGQTSSGDMINRPVHSYSRKLRGISDDRSHEPPTPVSRPGIISILLETHVTLRDGRENFTWVSRDEARDNSLVARFVRVSLSLHRARARGWLAANAMRMLDINFTESLLCICTFDAHEQSATVGGGGSVYCVSEFFYLFFFFGGGSKSGIIFPAAFSFFTQNDRWSAPVRASK